MKRIETSRSNCVRCCLYQTRTNIVVDDLKNVKVMIIGEGPGRNEDIQGKPFVGAAGKILEELLNSIGLTRNDVYIANVLKCRPPKNADPTDECVKKCQIFLQNEIRVIGPKIIAPLGKHATKWIFDRIGKEFTEISSLHGRKWKIKTLIGNVWIVPQYHPCVAIYDRKKKDVLLKDFQNIKEILNETKGKGRK